MSKVQEELNHILTGAGWATDDYVENFCQDLSEAEKGLLMIKLAKLGKLYSEGSITDYMSDTEPKSGRISVEEVVERLMK